MVRDPDRPRRLRFEPLETELLGKLTALAFAVAVVALAVYILPANYGVDPIGAGEALGWKAQPGPDGPLYQERNDTVDLTLAPGYALRWGFAVPADEVFRASWNATNGTAVDLVVELRPDGGGEPIILTNTTGPTAEGQRAFEPSVPGTLVFHWSLPEGVDQQTTVTLETTGRYQLLGAVRR